MSAADGSDDIMPQSWVDNILKAHEDAVKAAVDAAMIERTAASERREGEAFMRGMLIGSCVGIAVWIVIFVAVGFFLA